MGERCVGCAVANGIVTVRMHVQGSVIRGLPVEGGRQSGRIRVADRGLRFRVDDLASPHGPLGARVTGRQGPPTGQAEDHGRHSKLGGDPAEGVRVVGLRFNLRILTN